MSLSLSFHPCNWEGWNINIENMRVLGTSLEIRIGHSCSYFARILKLFQRVTEPFSFPLRLRFCVSFNSFPISLKITLFWFPLYYNQLVLEKKVSTLYEGIHLLIQPVIVCLTKFFITHLLIWNKISSLHYTFNRDSWKVQFLCRACNEGFAESCRESRNSSLQFMDL